MTRMTASPDRHHLARRMAELARALAQRTVEDVLIDVTTAAKEMIPGVDVAGVLLVGKDATHQTLATTDDLMFELDTLQMETGEGPCLHAALDEVMVRTDDFRAEPRFPTYASKVVDLGVLSALSFKLYTAERTAGALNLFGFAPHRWNGDAETVGLVLAAQRRSSDRGQPRRRATAVRVVHSGPHRPGQGHHHGALYRRRRPRLRDAAATVPRHQHQTGRDRTTRHRHPVTIPATPTESTSIESGPGLHIPRRRPSEPANRHPRGGDQHPRVDASQWRASLAAPSASSTDRAVREPVGPRRFSRSWTGHPPGISG